MRWRRDICREMIERFERHAEEQYPGRIGQTAAFDDSIKRSTDLVMSGKAGWRDLDRELFRSLNRAMNEFRQGFPFFRRPVQGHGLRHPAHRPRRLLPLAHRWRQPRVRRDRQLVAIWYLNDVDGPGGETQFHHQDVSIKPEAGKLLLFPPFWTHLHRGNTLQSGRKYIATTWVVFA